MQQLVEQRKNTQLNKSGAQGKEREFNNAQKLFHRLHSVQAAGGYS